jgi:hypothetical protein
LDANLVVELWWFWWYRSGVIVLVVTVSSENCIFTCAGGDCGADNDDDGGDDIDDDATAESSCLDGTDGAVVCGAAVAPSTYSWDDDVASCIMGSDADMALLFAHEHSFSVVRMVVIPLHEDSGESIKLTTLSLLR